MAFILFSGNGSGLSNNGDYTRIMKTNSLAFVTPVNVPYVYQAEFSMLLEGEDGQPRSPAALLFSLDGVEAYPSIHLLFIRTAMAANMGLNALTGAPMETFRVQILGLIYLLSYAGLFVLLFRSFTLPKLSVDVLVKLLVLFLLCDEGYITYFNSLYSEPVQMLGLLALVIFALRAFTGRGRLWSNALWLFLSCVVYGWAKFINLPIGALCILVLGGLLLVGATKRQRIGLVAGGVACIVLLGTVYLSLPKWMDEETNYNAVFFGVLKDIPAERQSAYLEELGLPQHMRTLAYSTYYAQRGVDGRDGDFSADFASVSKFDLLFFYLRHPAYLMEKLDVAVAHSGFIRPFYLSNLGADQVRLSFLNRFGGWSYLRGQLPFNTWAGNGLILALGCLALWRVFWRKGDRASAVLATLRILTVLGALAYHLIMPIITNGEADLAKHMFALAQMMDLLLLFLVARLGYFLCRTTRVQHPAPLLAGGLAVAVALTVFLPATLRTLRVNGDTVHFGSWEGKPIAWQIVAQEGDSLTLLARESVAVRPFSADGSVDGFGSSLWEGASLRTWLNGDFLTEAFTADERATLTATSHTTLLAWPDSPLAETGYNDFYCFHVPAYSDRAADLAFSKTATDLVRLPDVPLIASLARQDALSPVSCWTDTPYYNNASMLRVLAADGYLYMQDAIQPYGVRPMITVTHAQLPS